MAKSSITGLTEAKCRDHIVNNRYRSELSCQKIIGFHLQKLKNGGSWRFRYKDYTQKKRVIIIDKYTGNTANRLNAAEKAINYRLMVTNGIDPLTEKEDRQATYRQEELKKNSTLLGLYLNGIYTQHQKRKTDQGKHTLGMLRKHFASWIDRPMQSLSVADFKNWQAEKEQSGLSHATIKRTFGALRTMLRHAVREHILDSDPSEKFQLNPPTANEKEQKSQGDNLKTRRMLTAQELKGISKGLDTYKQQLIDKRENSRQRGKEHLDSLTRLSHVHWFFPFVHLAFYTGLRTGDLYSLNWQELNVHFKRLVKIPNKTRHHNDPIKIDLPLHDDILMIMKLWHEQQGNPTDGLVFPSPVTGKKIDKKAHLTHWKQVLVLAGITSSIDFYALRHHYISSMVAGGIALFTVARLAGHKSVSMIEQHYGHLAPHAASDALAIVAEGLKNTGSVNIKESII